MGDLPVASVAPPRRGCRSARRHLASRAFGCRRQGPGQAFTGAPLPRRGCRVMCSRTPRPPCTPSRRPSAPRASRGPTRSRRCATPQRRMTGSSRCTRLSQRIPSPSSPSRPSTACAWPALRCPCAPPAPAAVGLAPLPPILVLDASLLDQHYTVLLAAEIVDGDGEGGGDSSACPLRPGK